MSRATSHSSNTSKKMIEKYIKNPNIREKLAGVEASVQFRIDDDKPFYVKIDKGVINVAEGELLDPTVIVIAKKADLKKLIDREADPFAYYFSGRVKVAGKVLEAAELLRILLRELK